MFSFAQDSTGVDTGGAGSDGDSIGDFLKRNWGVLLPALLVFVEVIVRLTRTEKDNSILNFIKILVDAVIPNRAVKRIGGGQFGFMPPRDLTTKNSLLVTKEDNCVIHPKTHETLGDAKEIIV
jgi:hypothetical protein